MRTSLVLFLVAIKMIQGSVLTAMQVRSSELAMEEEKVESDVELEKDFLKGLEDVDWDEDWSDVELLCGPESLCCLDIPEGDESPTASATTPDESTTATTPDESKTSTTPASDGSTMYTTPDESTTSSSTCVVTMRRSERIKRSRFQTVIDDSQLGKAIVDRIPKNTARSTSWGVSVFLEWCEERQVDETLTSMSNDDINDRVARFVHEVVKRDGETPYPPNSLYQIVVAIQRFLKENGRPEVNFFESPVFDKLRKSLDARMKQLSSQGYGVVRRQAQPITRDMENILWEKGLFSCVTSSGLLNVVYFYNCKLFGLRAGDEHRELCVEQFSFHNGTNEELYMQFHGRNSKTYQGGLEHRKVLPKVLKIYSKPELGERDIVSCYQLYLNCIPNEGPFYRRPAPGKQLKFTKQVCGKNTLGKLVQKFCHEAGFQGFFTGHSGKVTCATELFNSNFDEQLIQHYTGHRSTDSVRAYKRAGEDHFKAVSTVLQPPPPTSSAPIKEASLPSNEANNLFCKLPSGSSFNASHGGNITFNFNYSH